MTHPLVEEAARKAAIAWFSVDGGPARALWCLTIDGDICLVLGPGEQELPGLARASSVAVTLRGDHGGNIATFPVTVTRIRPESERWEAVTTQLVGKRLNSTGPTEQVVQRWAREASVWALTPAGDPAPPDSSGEFAPPRPTTAGTATRKPFKLHRVRRKRT
ncbi:MAG TPA: hypothetical protein VFC19_40750 [Candidatus Limnocylindrales bacterium]|nr:hypothetical protein [Candidatus Limnocylindrales bacterium]